jgi:hypothetical protein
LDRVPGLAILNLPGRTDRDSVLDLAFLDDGQSED